MQHLGPFLFTALYVLNRWVHDVATTLFVGGVLFLEFVVPLATADLKDEQRAAVFGRARWVFQKVVWFSALLLVASGAVSTQRMWQTYTADVRDGVAWYVGPLPWVCGHALLGVLAMLIAFRVTAGRRLLERPVGWLRVTLAVLLVCIFLAVVARYILLRTHEWREFPQGTQRHTV